MGPAVPDGLFEPALPHPLGRHPFLAGQDGGTAVQGAGGGMGLFIAEEDCIAAHRGDLDPGLGKQARQLMRGDKRYRWLGGVPHERALRWLASSHAMVISSRMEGGANVVCEALRIGVPVLASRISGNVGLLGRDYVGYFPVEDEGALAGLMGRAASDRRFYENLKTQVKRLRAKVAPQAEARALLAAISGLRSAAPAGATRRAR